MPSPSGALLSIEWLSTSLNEGYRVSQTGQNFRKRWGNIDIIVGIELQATIFPWSLLIIAEGWMLGVEIRKVTEVALSPTGLKRQGVNTVLSDPNSIE
jgi:hypothetical protein